MKKIKILAVFCILVVILPGCGTILGGNISDCQAHKPAQGHRTLRWAPLIFDSPVGWIVDFSTGGIYRPCNKGNTGKP
jgi:hypothetical protein